MLKLLLRFRPPQRPVKIGRDQRLRARDSHLAKPHARLLEVMQATRGYWLMSFDFGLFSANALSVCGCLVAVNRRY